MRHRSAGFSVIELLMVIGIISIVLAFMMPALAGAREAARGTACGNNLKQMGLALHVYNNSLERFPIGYVARKDADPLHTDPGWGWSTMFLPHMEQTMVYKAIDFRQSTFSAASGTAMNVTIKMFLCPSDRETGMYAVRTEGGKEIGTVSTTSYAGCYGAGGDVERDPSGGNGFFVRNRAFALDDFTDGLSTTLAIGERGSLHTKTPWIGTIEGAVCIITPGAPSRSKKIGRGAVLALAHVGDKRLNSLDSDPDDFFSPHPHGGHFLLGDGSVRFFHESADPAILRAHASRNGGEIIRKDDL